MTGIFFGCQLLLKEFIDGFYHIFSFKWFAKIAVHSYAQTKVDIFLHGILADKESA